MAHTTKCQAKNPNQCTDPQCPERRGYRSGMANAQTYAEFATYRAKKAADEKKQAYINNFPRPSAPKPSPAPTHLPKTAGRPPQFKERTKTGDPVIKFHKDLGFPPGFNKPSGPRELEYGYHAIQEARNDKYSKHANDIPLFPKVNLSTMELIEVKFNQRTKKLYRMLYRTQLDDNRDICMVLSPSGPGKCKVVTVWVNETKDAHKTLRTEEYVDMRSYYAAKQTA